MSAVKQNMKIKVYTINNKNPEEFSSGFLFL